MDNYQLSKICCYIMLGLAGAVIIINIFTPATTFMLFLPWILLLFAYFFVFSYKLDVIIYLLFELGEEEEE